MALGLMVAGLAGIPRAQASGFRGAMARDDSCAESARRYETRCLMPRIQARIRFAEDQDPRAFVARMRNVDQACIDVTAGGLTNCPTWPRVAPTAEYRRWLRDVRATWEQRQRVIDGARPTCPAGVRTCL